jgi:hypothetical protein
MIVGLGGSGGKTLRLLWKGLRDQLLEAGWQPKGDNDMPSCFQFLHIDVPPRADGEHPDLPPQLPDENYCGLSPDRLDYHDIDELVDSQDHLRMATTCWRPNPVQVRGINPVQGAGQFRAVGRLLSIAATHEYYQRLQTAVHLLESDAVARDLAEVARALGATPAPAGRDPLLFVVASAAGGSGASMIIDVCDALRVLNRTWTGKAVGILYAPDVFVDLDKKQQLGVHANGLATICELMNGFWNTEEVTTETPELAHLHAVSQGARLRARGPEYPLLVGSANVNQQVRFRNQNDVYRTVASSLASLIMNGRVQDQFLGGVIGNWAQARGRDNSRLSGNRSHAFRSLGYASVGLGRERFAQYAMAQLSGQSVRVLRWGHLMDWDERNGDHAARDLDVQARDLASTVRRRARLRHIVNHPDPDQGEERDIHDRDEVLILARQRGGEPFEILDLLRGGLRAKARRDRMNKTIDNIFTDFRTNRPNMIPTRDAYLDVNRVAADYRQPFLDREGQSDLAACQRWAQEAPGRLVTATEELLAAAGAPVAAKVLADLAARLKAQTAPWLSAIAQEDRQEAGAVPQDPFAGIRRARRIPGDDPAIEQAIEFHVQTWFFEAESSLATLAAQLVADFADKCIAPLSRAVEVGLRALEHDATGEQNEPSVVDSWLTREVHNALLPARNELLLESPDSYAAQFDRLSREAAQVDDDGTARRVLTADVLRTGQNRDHPLLETQTRWWPRNLERPKAAAFVFSAGSQEAKYRAHLGANALLERSRSWLRGNVAFQGYVTMPLVSYLTAEGGDRSPAERAAQFETLFTQAVSLSLPLVEIDPKVNVRLRPNSSVAIKPQRIVSPVPFARTDALGKVIARELGKDGDQLEADKVFVPGGRQTKIEMTTFLYESYNIMSFSSVTQPVAEDYNQNQVAGPANGFWQWRRTRTLPQFIPVPPEIRHTLVRGWFAARLLSHVELPPTMSDLVDQRLKIWSPEGRSGTYHHFPKPLFWGLAEFQGFELSDALPTILEALPVAMVQAAYLGNEPLRAFWRLLDLGEAPLREGGAAGLNKELSDWLITGDGAGDDWSGDRPDRSASPKERHSWLDHVLSQYRSQYERLVRDSAPRTAPVGGSWEMRNDLLKAINDLLAGCAGWRPARSGPSEILG